MATASATKLNWTKDINYAYRIHHLPTADPVLLSYYIGKLTAVRLAALQNAPAAFGSSFARESSFTYSQWVTFLTRPLIHIFVAVSYSADTPLEDQTLETGDWIGCGTLIGPTPKKTFELPNSGGPEPGSDELEHKWHMTFVYNSPLHRGKGLMKRLIEAAIDFTVVEARTAGKKTSRVRCFISPGNDVVRTLYSGLGFEYAGGVTYVQGLTGNRDEDQVPADGGASDPAKWLTPVGSIFEKVLYV